MPEKLNVLFLPHPLGPSMLKPTRDDVIAAIGDRHNLRIFYDYIPLATQFVGYDLVI